MSIHVTVSGNPVYLDRSRILLTDIEAAKRNEWLRRRKIRLQQARQQAKDFAQSVRKKVTVEENIINKHDNQKKAAEENRIRKEKLASLHSEYEKTISSVGSGHHLASLKSECEALAQERQDLQDAIAKARGAIAEERQKVEKYLQKEKNQASIGRKKFTRQVEDLRSALISKLPEVKSSVPPAKKLTTKVTLSQCNEAEGVDSYKSTSPTKRTLSPSKQAILPRNMVEHHSRRSLSPPTSAQRPKSYRKEEYMDNKEGEGEEDDDADSDVTWPPRSGRSAWVTKEPLLPPKPPRVQFYDHSTRLAKFSESSNFYRVVEPGPHDIQPDMSAAITEEEDAFVRKENLDIMARREKMIRGNKALRRERSKKEAERILKELKEMERKEKIQMAVNRTYPDDIHCRDFYRKGIESTKINEMEARNQTPEVEGPYQEKGEVASKGVKFQNKITSEKITHLSDSTDCEDFIEELVAKLKEQKARKQQVLEKKYGVEGIEEKDVPDWVWQQTKDKDAPSGSKGIKRDKVGPQRWRTNNSKCSCSKSCTCGKDIDSFQQKEQTIPDMGSKLEEKGENTCDEKVADIEVADHPSSSSTIEFVREDIQTIVDVHPAPNDKDVSGSYYTQSSLTSNEGGSMESEMQSIKSNSESIESSLTFEGVQVTVKVSEKGVGVCEKSKKKKKKHQKLEEVISHHVDKDIQTSLELGDGQTGWDSKLNSPEKGVTSSGSTSYLSPPSHLSPAHQSLLRGILNKIDARNKNPKLHYYIKKLLEMSKTCIDDLPVSSVSDVSINSTLFDRSETGGTKPLDKSSGVCTCKDCETNKRQLEDSSCQDEALKFSELAETYLRRVEELAVMIDRVELLPNGKTEESGLEDSSYLSPPCMLQQSVRLDGRGYPLKPTPSPPPTPTGLPPPSIQPHPSTAPHLRPPASLTAQLRRLGGGAMGEAVAHELSTIQEGGESRLGASQMRPPSPQRGPPSPQRAPHSPQCSSPGPRHRPASYQQLRTPTSKGFDPDLSSIRGTPRDRDSACSSLGLLDERELCSWLGSSSDDYEDVFRSLGIGWALPTVRKTRQSQAGGSSSSSPSARRQYSHSTPLSQSPAKPRPQRPPLHSPTDSDSLTPPSLTLNIPQFIRQKNSKPRQSK